MPKLVFTPWRNDKELLQVRGQFYPSAGSETPDRRREACNRVHMWKLRGNLPHTIESTSSLTEAVLHDDLEVNPPSAVRAVYSTAFCRFVTGMTDIEQTTKYKQSMHKLAKEVGIPASFVEIRHEAIHGELPSLAVLRRATERALLWLYNEYWEQLDDTSSDPVRLRSALKDLLRTHLKVCLGAKSKDPLDAAKIKEESVTATNRGVATLCQNEVEALQMLVDILLERKMLVPSTKVKMTDTFQLWDKLLKRITFYQRRFLILLTDSMTLAVMRPCTKDVAKDCYREALAMWLHHIHTEDSWQFSRTCGLLVVDSPLQACTTNPGHWILQLAITIIDDPQYAEARAKYLEQCLKEMKRQSVEYSGSNMETLQMLANLPDVPAV